MEKFWNYLTSGFGTGTTAAKAIGWVIAIGLIGLWVFWWFIKLFWRFINWASGH